MWNFIVRNLRFDTFLDPTSWTFSNKYLTSCRTFWLKAVKNLAHVNFLKWLKIEIFKNIICSPFFAIEIRNLFLRVSQFLRALNQKVEKILWCHSFQCKNLLNFTCLTIRFHSRNHKNDNFLFKLPLIGLQISLLLNYKWRPVIPFKL